MGYAQFYVFDLAYSETIMVGNSLLLLLQMSEQRHRDNQQKPAMVSDA